MASAGLLQLLHSGLQDERLLPPKGQPTLSAFQKVYVKGGRFTTEWARVDFDNRPVFGQTAKATLPRRGHLITRAFLMVTMPDIRTKQQEARDWCTTNGRTFAGPTFGWTNSIGHALVQQAQLTIGAAPIDTLDGRLMEILDEFHTPLEKLTVLNRMIGRHDAGFSPKKNGWSTANQELAVPLPFWFSRGDPSAALPIDAIGTDLVQLSVTFTPVANLYTTTTRTKNAQGQTTQPAMASSPFYCLDPSSSSSISVSGLNGNPEKSLKVSEISDDLLDSTVSLPNGTGETAESSQTVSLKKATKITMPSTFELQSAYLLLEYVYLDKPEANRIRLGNIDYPIVQHYAIPPFNTKSATNVRIPMRIPNPCRELYFMAHRTEADLLNAPFLATRDLSGLPIRDVSGVGTQVPWWPDASGLNTSVFRPLVPAFSTLESEPIDSISLLYEGRLVRYATDAPAFFRSILPSFEQKKTPWHNKFIYHLPFGTQSEFFGVTSPMGHANLDKITRLELSLQMAPNRGSAKLTDTPSYTIFIYAETYNILKVFGGRAGLLFAY